MYKNFTILWIVINAETAQTKNKAIHSISTAEKLGNFFSVHQSEYFLERYHPIS